MGTPKPIGKLKIRRVTISGSVAHEVADAAEAAARSEGVTLSAFVAAAVEERAKRVNRKVA